jgi:hypothetical protein
LSYEKKPLYWTAVADHGSAAQRCERLEIDRTRVLHVVGDLGPVARTAVRPPEEEPDTARPVDLGRRDERVRVRRDVARAARRSSTARIRRQRAVREPLARLHAVVDDVGAPAQAGAVLELDELLAGAARRVQHRRRVRVEIDRDELPRVLPDGDVQILSARALVLRDVVGVLRLAARGSDVAQKRRRERDGIEIEDHRRGSDRRLRARPELGAAMPEYHLEHRGLAVTGRIYDLRDLMDRLVGGVVVRVVDLRVVDETRALGKEDPAVRGADLIGLGVQRVRGRDLKVRVRKDLVRAFLDLDGALFDIDQDPFGRNILVVLERLLDELPPARVARSKRRGPLAGRNDGGGRKNGGCCHSDYPTTIHLASVAS